MIDVADMTFTNVADSYDAAVNSFGIFLRIFTRFHTDSQIMIIKSYIIVISRNNESISHAK